MKKIMSIVLIAFLLLSMSSFVVADTADNALDLYELNLLKGDGTGFSLDRQLPRREAVTFIVRLLGKEEQVQNRSNIYSQTGFSDVNQTDWFAPYVGYCVDQGIVEGFGDGTFRPNEFVSEKAFLKMVLEVMNYEYNEDFGWTNSDEMPSVFRFAYQKGLVTEESYTVEDEDNNNYTRGDVVDALWHSLTKRINDSNQFVAQMLIDEGVFSERDAEQVGIVIEDELETAIEDLDVVSQTKIEVTFNEELDEIKLSDVSIDDLEVKSIILNGDTLTINTSAQASEKDYTLTIDSVVDVFGHVVEDLEEDFNGYTMPEVKSNYFKISKIEVLNDEIINVYFTHPINQNAELPLLYNIEQDGDEVVEGSFNSITAKLISGVDNGISLYLQDYDLDEGEEYTLDIKPDLSSAYGVNLGEGDGEVKDFDATFIGGVEKFKVEDVMAITYEDEEPDDKFLRVVYSSNYDKSSALNSSNYSLDNLDGPDSADIGTGHQIPHEGSDLRMIDFEILGALYDDEYELTIEDVEDQFGIFGIDDEYDFYGYREYLEPLKIEGVGAINERLIQVYFNQEIKDKPIVNVTGGVSAEKVYFDEEKPYLLYVYLDEKMNDNDDYTVQIQDVKDVRGVSEFGLLEFDFEGTDRSFDPPRIKDAYFISEDKVLVKFNLPVDTGLSASDVELEYDDDGDDEFIDASSISFKDPLTAIVTFKNTSSDEDYDINIDNLEDYGTIESVDVSKSVYRE